MAQVGARGFAHVCEVTTDGQIAAWAWHVAPKAVELDGTTYWRVTLPLEGRRSGAAVVQLRHEEGTYVRSPVPHVTDASDDRCNPPVRQLHRPETLMWRARGFAERRDAEVTTS